MKLASTWVRGTREASRTVSKGEALAAWRRVADALVVRTQATLGRGKVFPAIRTRTGASRLGDSPVRQEFIDCVEIAFDPAMVDTIATLVHDSSK